MHYNGYWLAELIYRGCPGTRDKLDIWRGNAYDYYANGVDYYIRFIGLNGTKAQMRLIPGEDTPLTGHNIVFN